MLGETVVEALLFDRAKDNEICIIRVSFPAK